MPTSTNFCSKSIQYKYTNTYIVINVIKYFFAVSRRISDIDKSAQSGYTYSITIERTNMNLNIIFSGENINLPLSHKHDIQGLIYRAVKNSSEFSSFLHDDGYRGGNGVFRLFTFGELIGSHRRQNRSIVFPGGFRLEIRSVSEQFISDLAEYFRPGSGHMLLSNDITVANSTVSQTKIESGEIRIRTLSPIIAKRKSSKKTVYFSPADPEFNEIINSNFRAKYQACYGKEPASCIEAFGAEGLTKVVTRYKGLWINAFFADITLRGEPEYLEFLYNTGLGCKNSQGFGMFDVIDD